jgi:DNA-binding MarR family transcriptional regulator
MTKVTPAEYQALAEFRYQIRAFLTFSDQAVRSAGIEKQQYQFMLAIKGMPDGMRPRMRDLSNRMLIQHHSAVELANRLEAGGFIRRERSADDKREVLLTVTPKGERVLNKLALNHHQELQNAAPKLLASLRRVTTGK